MGSSPTRGDEGALRERALGALHRAVEFFRTKVATEGGYLWQYAEDLRLREGEGKASATTVWVQSPGTPAVGEAYLRAHRATRDRRFLEAARDTARCLVRGQLVSGGWDYRIEFAPQARRRYAYRADGEERGSRNTTTLDDDTTQAALRFLMRVDRALDFGDPGFHGAVEYALARLIEAQYPNGAFPQRFDRPVDPAKFPVKKASYPESWSRRHPRHDYRSYYTFNDNSISDVIETLFEASRIYGRADAREAATKAGDFILLARLPEPQPAWAQQYDAEMHPAWARRFEPPAVTGGESHGILRTLLILYQETGEKKYLEPLPAAIAYFQRSRLPGGGLARFYELRTNRPLYFTKDYDLTYSDSDLPTHYGFKVGDWTAPLLREYRRVTALPTSELGRPPETSHPQLGEALRARARAAIESLDDEGRWVEEGRLSHHGSDVPTGRVIRCATFSRNVEALCAYLEASAPGADASEAQPARQSPLPRTGAGSRCSFPSRKPVSPAMPSPGT